MKRKGNIPVIREIIFKHELNGEWNNYFFSKNIFLFGNKYTDGESKLQTFKKPSYV